MIKSRIFNAADSLLKYFKIGRLAVSVHDATNGEDARDDYNSFERLFTIHPWTYAGIYAIASSAASVPIRVMRKMKDGKSEEVVDHPFIKLIENPNDFMTGYDLIELSFIFLEATGESYWLYDDLKGETSDIDGKISLSQVKEIWPLPSSHIKPVPHAEKFRNGYRYNPEGSTKGKVFNNAEVQYLKYSNPLSMHRGLGSIAPAQRNISGELFADTWNNNFFKNGGLPAAFLKTEQRLDPDQATRLKADWAKMYQGVKGAHKIALLESGLDIAVPNQSRKDMEFDQLLQSSMRRTLACLGVPLIMVGIGDEQSYNNAGVQERVFWRNTMAPKFRKVAGMLTKKLHQFGESEDLFVVFDTSDIDALKADQSISATTAKLWTAMGMPLNQALDIFMPGTDHVEGGDIGYIPFGVVPIEDAQDILGDIDSNPEGESVEGKLSYRHIIKSRAVESDDETDAVASEKKYKLDTIYWKKFILNQNVFFKRMKRAVKKRFRAQEAIVQKNILEQVTKSNETKIKATSPDLLIFDLNSENKKLYDEGVDHIIGAIKKSGAQVLNGMEVGISFDIQNPRAIKYLESKRMVIKGINEHTQSVLREKLSQALADGKTQSEISKIVAKEFDGMVKFRADRIARTEIGSSANFGINEGQQQGIADGSVFTHKEWIQSRDNDVRDEHRVTQTQKVGDPFDIGGEFLMYPGDNAGSPWNFINCRCTTIPVRG